MEMVSEAILGILHTGRRAVIPGLGAFLRKDGEQKVVFVEFLKKDDGVLAGVLLEQYGLSAREAQEAVGGFVGDLQRMVATPEGFIIEGLGVMRIDANGVLDLQFDPDVRARTFVEEPFMEEEPPQEIVVEEELIVEFDPQDEAFEIVAKEDEPAVFDESAELSEQIPSPIPASGLRSVDSEEEEQMVFELAPDPEPQPARARRSLEQLLDEPKTDPEPFDDADMRYHKPAKQVKTPRRKHADMIMVIAIAAAALAIAAMIFGTLVERRNRLPLPEATEQVADSSEMPQAE